MKDLTKLGIASAAGYTAGKKVGALSGREKGLAGGAIALALTEKNPVNLLLGAAAGYAAGKVASGQKLTSHEKANIAAVSAMAFFDKLSSSRKP